VDVVLINASVFSLPGSQRAGAIVYDGTIDLELWRPPGPDRDLLHAYGDTLGAVLAKERSLLASGRLAPGQALRLHPGKLRCDYLIWVGSRPPHGDAEPSPAPPLEALEQVARSALLLASKHDTSRVAFGVIGAGREQVDAGDRMAAAVRGAHAFREQVLQEALSTPIEEILVCSPSAAEVAKARRLTSRLTRTAAVEPPRGAAEPARRAASSQSGPGRSVTGAGRRSRGRKLDPAEVARARTRAEPYDRSRTYHEGDWFLHPTFGVGQVQLVLGPERMVTTLYEDGEERRLIHDRS
jgi:O-acetyl-ADP-ribose deacetylase (regulator of RNase III)